MSHVHCMKIHRKLSINQEREGKTIYHPKEGYDLSDIQYENEH